MTDLHASDALHYIEQCSQALEMFERQVIEEGVWPCEAVQIEAAISRLARQWAGVRDRKGACTGVVVYSSLVDCSSPSGW